METGEMNGNKWLINRQEMNLNKKQIIQMTKAITIQLMSKENLCISINISRLWKCKNK